MKRTLIAAAVLAASSGSVFAHGHAYLFNETGVTENVNIWGGVLLYGCVGVSNTTGAVVNNNQNIDLDGVHLRPNDPTGGTYQTGSVTTTYANTRSSVNAGGSLNGSITTTNFHASGGAQGFQESSGYAYANQQAGIVGGGYEYSQQSAGIAGGFYSVGSNHGGGFSVSGGPTGGHPPFIPPTGYTSNYSGYNYANGGGVAGYFQGSEGSGQGALWGYSANEGSGGQAFAEQSSGYNIGGSINSDSLSAQWDLKSHYNVTDETTMGSVTTHYNDTPTGQLDATMTDPGNGGGNSGVNGNVGINITEGVDNAQSNDASLAMIQAGNVFGNAQVFNNQSSSGYANVKNFDINASVSDGALAGATGNIGVNVAAGVGNAQNNSLAAASTTMPSGNGWNNGPSGDAMVATDQNEQQASLNFDGKFGGTASLAGSALTGASGNIGINIAGGAGNLQHNGLAIAALTMPASTGPGH